jgi:outer membrane biosynthesis protein TonB
MISKPLSRLFAALLGLAFLSALSARAQDAAAAPAAEQPAPAEQPAAEATPPASEGGISQGEAALALVGKLGLFPALGNAPSPQQAAAALSAQGIAPFGGWNPSETLTVGDFAKILVESMGRQDEIAPDDRNNPEAYVQLLRSLNIQVESKDSFDQVGVLAETFNAAVDGPSTNSDPLRSRIIYSSMEENAGSGGLGSLRAQAGVAQPPAPPVPGPTPPRRSPTPTPKPPAKPEKPVDPSPVDPSPVLTRFDS